MFFVAGEKVYLSEYNNALKAYPEVKLFRNDEGEVYMEIQASGISKKPITRSICTAEEVLAQFGAGATKKRSESSKTSGK